MQDKKIFRANKLAFEYDVALQSRVLLGSYVKTPRVPERFFLIGG